MCVMKGSPVCVHVLSLVGVYLQAPAYEVGKIFMDAHQPCRISPIAANGEIYLIHYKTAVGQIRLLWAATV